MSRMIQWVCLLVLFSVTSSFAADVPALRQSFDPVRESAVESGPILVGTKDRLRARRAAWSDGPVEYIFNSGSLVVDHVGDMPKAKLSVARMLQARCFVYCPKDELPIEAIYRERLANHGVKVFPFELPSRCSLLRQQEPQKPSLIAMLK